MSAVIEIGISKEKGGKIINLNDVEVIKGEGILNDRKSKTNNDKAKQITLIEIENIEYYNEISTTNFPASYFRRNFVTKNVKLNELLNKEFFIGNVKVFAHDLCRPCNYLQKLLKKDNIIKELLYKGGLRCEVLSSGKISVGDLIKFN
jgi:MOSC domain-containing protein YiiM